MVRSRAGDMAVTEEEVGPLKALLTNGVADAGDLGLGGATAAARRPGHCGVGQPDPAYRCADAARTSGSLGRFGPSGAPHGCCWSTPAPGGLMQSPALELTPVFCRP